MPVFLTEELWGHPVPALERAMKGRRLRITDEIRDLANRERLLAQKVARGLLPCLVEQLLKRHALSGKPPLKRSPRHPEVTSERADPHLAGDEGWRQRAPDVEHHASPSRLLRKDRFGVRLQHLPQDRVPPAKRKAPGVGWDASGHSTTTRDERYSRAPVRMKERRRACAETRCSSRRIVRQSRDGGAGPSARREIQG